MGRAAPLPCNRRIARHFCCPQGNKRSGRETPAQGAVANRLHSLKFNTSLYPEAGEHSHTLSNGQSHNREVVASYALY